jgi:hypothetical protein
VTIHSVTPAWSRLTSGDSTEDGQRFQITRSTGLQVIHDWDTEEEEILADSRVTQLGDRYRTTFAVCKKRNVVKSSSPILSIVACEYSGEAGPGGQEDSPLNKPLEYKWGSVSSTEPIDLDARGRPIVTPNGEQINGIVKTLNDSVITFKKNFETFTNSTKQAYLDAVNSDILVVGPDTILPGTAKLMTCDISPMKFGDFEYVEVSGTIHVRYPYNTTPAKAWWSRTRLEGFYERLGPEVTFSDAGGGTGAEAVAFATDAGVLTGIFVTKPGSGYTAATTVSVSGGTGATFSVTRGYTDGQQIASVSVLSGGSGYKVRIVHAENGGVPVVKPVLLKANGFREKNPANAVWIETEKYLPLPYSVLGFD